MDEETKMDGVKEEVAMGFLSLLGALMLKFKQKVAGSSQKTKDTMAENVELRKALEEKQRADVCCLTSRIDAHEAVLAQIASQLDKIVDNQAAFQAQMDELVANVQVMHSMVDDLKADADVKKLANKFKLRIENIGQVFLRSKKDLPSAMNGMITAGCNEAAKLFSDMLLTGIYELDLPKEQDRALDMLRGIRATYATAGNDVILGKDFVKKLKRKLKPELLVLFATLAQLKNGEYNGSTVTHFQTTVVAFVNGFISTAITAYEEKDV